MIWFSNREHHRWSGEETHRPLRCHGCITMNPSLYTLRYSTRLHRSGHIDLYTAVSKEKIMEHSQDGFVSKAVALCQVVIMIYIYHQFTFTSHSLSIGTNHLKLFNSSRTGYTRRNTQLRSHPVNYIVTCTFYAKPHQGHQSHHNLPLQVGSTCI